MSRIRKLLLVLSTVLLIGGCRRGLVGEQKLEGADMSPTGEVVLTETMELTSVPSGNKKMGYIKKVFEKDGKRWIEIDYAEMLSGEEGNLACVRDGECKKGCGQNDKECLPNGYYVSNQNKLTRILEVDRKAVTESLKDNGVEPKMIGFEELSRIFASPTRDEEWLVKAPYNIEFTGEVVTKISQQYIP